MGRSFVVAALVALALVGCGGGVESPTAVASVEPTPSPAPTATPSPAPTPTPEPTPGSTPTPGPTPTPTPTPVPSPSPSPTPIEPWLKCSLKKIGRNPGDTGVVWTASWETNTAYPEATIKGDWSTSRCADTYAATGYSGAWTFTVTDNCGDLTRVRFWDQWGTRCSV